jgi:hypothetical protein
MNASRAKRSAAGLAFAIVLSFAGWSDALAQAAPLTPSTPRNFILTRRERAALIS